MIYLPNSIIPSSCIRVYTAKSVARIYLVIGYILISAFIIPPRVVAIGVFRGRVLIYYIIHYIMVCGDGFDGPSSRARSLEKFNISRRRTLHVFIFFSLSLSLSHLLNTSLACSTVRTRLKHTRFYARVCYYITYKYAHTCRYYSVIHLYCRSRGLTVRTYVKRKIVNSPSRGYFCTFIASVIYFLNL
jgi:hypothetical protein